MQLAHESSHKVESPIPQEISYQIIEKDTGGLDGGAAEASLPESHDSPRRRTRSQTGSTGKRRLSDEVQPPSPQGLATSRKKQRAASKISSTSTDVDAKDERSTDSPVTDSKYTSQPTTRSPSPLGATPPLTFLESSASPGYAPERRGPRTRATLPVPVPNLTKKSRGRRVPTQEVTEVQSEAKEKRMYICKVEGCGKCFHRGEHLKRHIRSIHTHEKPFMCTHPACGKYFNRHDNLLQHLKVHRQNSREEEGNPRPFLKLSPPSPSPSPEPEPSMDHDSGSSASESESEARVASPAKSTFPVTPVSYDPYVPSTRFGVSCESFTTNMAVSSLRTELPSHSPPTSRVRDSL